MAPGNRRWRGCRPALYPSHPAPYWLNGKDLAKDRREALDEVGILFQNPDHQIIFLAVLDEVVFRIEQKGASRGDTATLA